jgi:hypothetical protein
VHWLTQTYKHTSIQQTNKQTTQTNNKTQTTKHQALTEEQPTLPAPQLGLLLAQAKATMHPLSPGEAMQVCVGPSLTILTDRIQSPQIPHGTKRHDMTCHVMTPRYDGARHDTTPLHTTSHPTTPHATSHATRQTTRHTTLQYRTPRHATPCHTTPHDNTQDESPNMWEPTYHCGHNSSSSSESGNRAQCRTASSW